MPYTDNQATAKIVEVGSMKFEWHTPALRIVKICYEHIIHLDIEWVPRDCNTRAGFISKLIDFIQDLRVLIYESSFDTVRNRNSILGSPNTPRYVVVLRMNVEFLG